MDKYFRFNSCSNTTLKKLSEEKGKYCETFTTFCADNNSKYFEITNFTKISVNQIISITVTKVVINEIPIYKVNLILGGVMVFSEILEKNPALKSYNYFKQLSLESNFLSADNVTHVKTKNMKPKLN